MNAPFPTSSGKSIGDPGLSGDGLRDLCPQPKTSTAHVSTRGPWLRQNNSIMVDGMELPQIIGPFSGGIYPCGKSTANTETRKSWMYETILVPVEMGQIDRAGAMLSAACHLLTTGGKTTYLAVLPETPGHVAADLPRNPDENPAEEANAALSKVINATGVAAIDIQIVPAAQRSWQSPSGLAPKLSSSDHTSLARKTICCARQPAESFVMQPATFWYSVRRGVASSSAAAQMQHAPGRHPSRRSRTHRPS